MKKLFNRALVIALLLVLVVGVLPVTGQASGGKCGDNATWNLSGTVLTISGTGKMDDYAPWLNEHLSITQIVIQSGITHIGDLCFASMPFLTSVSIPDTVTSIGSRAFANCNNLSTIKLPQKLKKIGDGCFLRSWIAQITIPSSVTSIGEGAFSGCEFSKIELPSTITKIPNNCFNGCFKLQEITFKGKITSIGENAFRGCTALTGFKVPSTVTSIGAGAFAGCTGLKDLTVASTNSYFCASGGKLMNKNKTTLVAYPTAKGDAVTIPNSIKKISASCFQGTKVTGITIPSGVTELGNYCFADSSLKTVTLPAALKTIGDYAFFNTELERVTVPEGVQSIGSYAFSENKRLKQVSLPASVTSIGEDCFTLSEKLETVKVASGNKNYSSKEGILLDKSEGSLMWVSHARTGSLVIPYGVTRIPSVLGGSGYTTITIPETVTYFDNYNFGRGSNKTYIFLGDCPEFGGILWAGNVICYDPATSGWEEHVQTTWKTIKTLRYNANGGSDAPGAQRITSGTYTLSTAKPTRTGYTFRGWATSKSATTAKYQPGDKISLSASKTLYAVWKGNQYTVKFSKNGGTSGSMDALSGQKYGVKFTLPANAFKRTGYTFAGWNTKADGSGTAYKNQASVKNLTTKNGATVTLYAQWKPIRYNVVFDGNKATDGEMNKAEDWRYGSEYTLPANKYTRKGYTFIGWNTKADGSGTAYENKAAVKNLTTKNGTDVKLYARWKANTYSIKFNGNGKTSGSMTAMTDLKYGKTYTIPPVAYKRTGYDFVCWNTKQDGTGTPYWDQNSVKSITSKDGGSVTLYAQWEKKCYTIIIMDSTGWQDTIYLTKEYGETIRLPSELPERDNQCFDGWSTTIDGPIRYHFNDEYSKNADLTLFTQWRRNQTIIRYHGNGATSGSMEDAIVESFCRIPECQFQRIGYEFAGWNTREDGKGTQYLADDELLLEGRKDGEVFNLYAIWEKTDGFAITFDSGWDATGGPESMVKRWGEDMVIPDTIPTASGRHFAGWATVPDASAPEYRPGDVYSSDVFRTLYAVWTPATYTLRFHGNGAESGEMADLTDCVFGTDIQLPVNQFQKSGYDFLHWDTNPECWDEGIENCGLFRYWSWIDGEVVTLYAHWMNYSIELIDLIGDHGSTLSKVAGQTVLLPAELGEVENWHFVGWSTSQDGSVCYAPGAEYSEDEDITLYAVWEVNRITVRFDGNGADSGSMDNIINQSSFDTFYIPDCSFERYGYAFAGWNTRPDGSGTSFISGDEVWQHRGSQDGDVFTLYAIWEKTDGFTITFDSGWNATGGPESMVKRWGEDMVIPDTIPTASGRHFAGWATVPDASDPEYRPGDVYSSDVFRTLYAVWTPATYTIHFDGNGAESGEMADLTDCAFGTDIQLPVNQFQKSGYDFLHWDTDPKCWDEGIENCGLFRYWSWIDGEVVTLYAHWMNYSIKLIDLKGDHGSMLSKVAGQTVLLPAELGEVENWHFVGWSTSYDGPICYAPGAEYSEDEDISLYAVWEVNRITVRFDGNGADSGSMDNIINQSSFDTFCIPDCSFKRYGYAFAGWNTRPDGSGTSFISGDEVWQHRGSQDGDVFTLYAIWEKTDGFTITFDSGWNATGGPESMVKRWGEDMVIPDTIPTASGRRFAGWATVPDASDPEYRPGDVYSSDVFRTLYAVWTPATYTLRFHGNGADSGEMEALTGCLYGQQINLPECQFTREGYSFVDWDADWDGELVCTDAFFEEHLIYNSWGNIDGAVTDLYAHWEPNE